MNDSNDNSQNISRRDWFRLRVRQSVSKDNQTLGIEQSPESASTLVPIEHPPNYDGLDLSELPPMREAELSVEQVDALFQDISGLATDVQVMQRSTRGTHATAQKAESVKQLQFAKSALLTGAVPRLQIRYRWEDCLWIDTLANQRGNFKLIRIAHQLG